jgi:hypothetical protein
VVLPGNPRIIASGSRIWWPATGHARRPTARDRVEICQNALRGRWENLWSCEQTCVVNLVDRAAVIDKLVYTASNPVADHLVDRVLIDLRREAAAKRSNARDAKWGGWRRRVVAAAWRRHRSSRLGERGGSRR